jgi:drug/metabolite transporter (DMT)-like permease
MPLWISVTIFAAFMQNLRFLLQRHLKTTTLSTSGATWSRFLFSAPLVAIIVVTYSTVSDQHIPDTNSRFWAFIISGGLSQMIATMCVVALFAHRNFAVGITLKKTEVILTAILGLALLGEAVSAPVVVAIGVGFIGVLFLSDPPKGDVAIPFRARIFNPASGYGLASGLLFGISAVGYRGASLSLDSGDVFLRASFTLAVATAIQTISLGLWLLWRDRDEVVRVFQSWRISSLVGITSMLGSLGWFTAFTLQTAAYVKALGQVELIFTFVFSIFYLRERSTRKEIIGISFIVLSLALILWGSL